MARQKDNLPAPPELPSFRVEPSDEDRDRQGKSVAERHEGTGLVRHDAFLDESSIDPDAAKVVRRLERHGFQAYLVGGCIRDLLLGGRPKDFDIATSARPEDVRSLFRNCRVIGRRFRLAHVLFGGGKVIEVATFRKNPQALDEEEEDLLIRSDNVFGEAHEDAIRRDFTINALFYDLDRRQVLDWCGGMEDIAKRTIRTIGEPSVRFREDPVRILRAIKFAGRLDLGIEHNVYDAMVSHREDLGRAARPRVFEEVLRLVRQGSAHRAMWITWESGVMAVLMPELAAFLDDEESHPEAVARFWRQLDAVDRTTHARGPIDDVVLMSALFYEPLQEAMADSRDRMRAASDFLGPVAERVAIPRRVSDSMRRILALLPRLRSGRAVRAGRNGEMIAYAQRVLELVSAS
ncbi:MAG TPA: polynucleotide adenylyltransferase PcnB [Polyangiaceae bacterium]|jgi:poly(A) polymerase